MEARALYKDQAQITTSMPKCRQMRLWRVQQSHMIHGQIVKHRICDIEIRQMFIPVMNIQDRVIGSAYRHYYSYAVPITCE